MKRIILGAALAAIVAMPAHAGVTWNLVVMVGTQTVYPGGGHKTEAGCTEARSIAREALKLQKAKGIAVYCLPLMDTQ